jgi:oligopeptidase B
MKFNLLLLSSTLVLEGCSSPDRESAHAPSHPQPPVAQQIPKVQIIHGERLVDNYFWLREKTNPAVVAYLKAENAYTDTLMKPRQPLEERIYKEILSHIKETDMQVPYRSHGYYYYSRTEQGKQYAIHCRKKGALDAAEEVTVDLNALANGEKFMQIGAYTVSDDSNLLAYSLDRTGFRQYTLQIKDLRTGRVLPDRIKKTGSVEWAADNRTLFYTVEDDAKRMYRIYKHRLGAAPNQDEIIYEEKDERFEVAIGRSRSEAYLFLHSQSHTTSEARYLPANEPDGTWKIIAPRIAEQEYDVEHHGESFFIRANDKGRNFRLVKAPVTNPGRDHWEEVIPHRSDVMLEGVEIFAKHYVLTERGSGLPQLRINDFGSGPSRRIAFPEPAYDATPGINAEFNTRVFRYSYDSFLTPGSVFEYDIDRGESKLLKRKDVPGGYDPEHYESKRLLSTAPDGTRVPISLVYRKGLVRDGRAPLLLEAYGSYGYPYRVSFSSAHLSLLDRGVVYACAHIRGGGDFGKRWHDEGRMMNKRNTFTDFIACAEFLINEKFTSKDRLAITGGSAGGLLMGAVVNMRPDLFRVVVSHVPFVDVINTMLDESLPLTVGEFEEWGNPKKREEYAYMKSYSPYDNLRRTDYPAMMVKTSLNDSQVMYWEPAKYVAKLRTLKTDHNPLLLKVNMAAGHGGSSGRYDHLREVAFDYAFLLGEFGIND